MSNGKLFSLVLLLSLGATLVATPAQSHKGDESSQGCHTDARTGDYHCHGQKASPPSRETYCHVVNGSRRCGYARSTCNNLVSEYGGYCRAE